MQNKYVGDVGDFGKHGLLRFLSGMTDVERPEPNMKLGLVWYLFHDEIHNNHGDQTAFLNRTPRDDKHEYRECDPCLWETLRDLVHREDARCVHCAQLAGIFPEKTEYYGTPLYYMPEMNPARRRELREFWFGQALQATQDAELVYVDPDTGIGRDALKYQAKGPKYTYVSDLQAIWERGQSLVVYHHLGMTKGGAEDMTRAAAARIREGLGTEPISLLFHPGGCRVFYVVPRPEHKGLIRERVDRFLKFGWEKHGHFGEVQQQ